MTALVVYLRPARRPMLLSALAELGILVVESRPDAWRRFRSTIAPDLLVLVGNGDVAHVNVAAGLAAESFPLLVITEGPEQVASYERAGASSFAEAGTFEHLMLAIREVAARARTLRETSPAANRTGSTVFGVLRFELNPPQLLTATRSVSLSGVERDALLALAQAGGAPLSTDALRTRIASGSSFGSGYVKSLIHRIRRKAERLGADPELLVAVRGYGYMLRG